MAVSENPALLAVVGGDITTAFCDGDFFFDFNILRNLVFEPMDEYPGVFEIKRGEAGPVIGYTRNTEEADEQAREFVFGRKQPSEEEFLQGDIM